MASSFETKCFGLTSAQPLLKLSLKMLVQRPTRLIKIGIFLSQIRRNIEFVVLILRVQSLQ
jgi:hypothetical protein